LRSALSEARRQGLVSTNAAWRLRLPRGARPVAWTREREKLWRATGAKPRVAVWEVGHVAEFLDAVRDDPLFPLWWLIALRGLRRGEAVAVRGTDLDERYRELNVRRQLLVVDGKVHALVRKLGLPPVRLHDLRHGAASMAGAAGVELKVIQHDLGHSSAVTTADTYWTVFRELAHRAVEATAKLLRSHARFRLNLGAASQA
jgi:integrase